MNQYSVQLPRITRPERSVPRAEFRTQAIPDPPPIYQLTPMGTLKMLHSCMLAAAAGVLSESQEWRLFGGLLAGAVIGGAAGMVLSFLFMKRMPWEIYALRFLANLLCGLGVGVILLYVLIHYAGAHPGPLLTTGCGFIGGLMGVAAVRIIEPALLRRLEKISDESQQMPEQDRYDIPPRPCPPTVKLTERP